MKYWVALMSEPPKALLFSFKWILRYCSIGSLLVVAWICSQSALSRYRSGYPADRVLLPIILLVVLVCIFGMRINIPEVEVKYLPASYRTLRGEIIKFVILAGFALWLVV
jgi:hypothetical protein